MEAYRLEMINIALRLGGEMGAWGTAIFSDDLACDVRDDYKRCFLKGLSH